MTPARSTSSENTLATAVHLLAIPFPLWAPIIALFVASSKKSDYLKYHAWQALLSEIAAMLITFTVGAISLINTIINATQWWPEIQKGNWSVIDWKFLLIKSGAVLLAGLLFSLWNTIANIINAAKAYKGDEWGGRGLVARLSRKWSLGSAHRPPLT